MFSELTDTEAESELGWEEAAMAKRGSCGTEPCHG